VLKVIFDNTLTQRLFFDASKTAHAGIKFLSPKGILYNLNPFRVYLPSGLKCLLQQKKAIPVTRASIDAEDH
jgi:hypothetical protein